MCSFSVSFITRACNWELTQKQTTSQEVFKNFASILLQADFN